MAQLNGTGCWLPQGSRSRSAGQPGACRCRHRRRRRPRLRSAQNDSGRTDSVDTAVQAGAADASVRRRRPGVDRRSGIRPHPPRATGRPSAAGRRRRTVPGHRPCPGASPRPGPSAVGVLGHRGPETQPVGDLDEDPPPHGRRHLGGPHPHQALRRRRQRHVRQSRWRPRGSGVTRRQPELGRHPVAGFSRHSHQGSGKPSPERSGPRCGPRRSARGTTMRRYSTVRVPIAAVDGVCRKFGVTTNDVALAAITEGFRMVLLHRGEQPRADSLRTLEKIDNRISVMLPYLPVEHDDPVQRLRTVHNRLNQPGKPTSANPAASWNWQPTACHCHSCCAPRYFIRC